MLQSTWEEVLSFYNFLKYPQQNIFKETLSFENFFPILLSYYFVFICGILIMAPLAALIGLEDIPHKLEAMNEMNMWLLLFLAVLTQPFLEEVFFRLPLKYTRGLLVLLCTMAGMIIYMILSKFNLPDITEGIRQDVVFPLLITFLLIICVFLFSFSEQGFVRLRNIVSKYFPHFFYAVAVYFAFVHFFNYEASGNQWLFTPIMVLPQFIIALFVGYTRLKYGFLSAVVIHMINNLIPMLFIIFGSEI